MKPSFFFPSVLPLLTVCLGLLLFSSSVSGNQEASLPVLPVRPEALMDFDFAGSGGKQSFKDRTGNYTIISETAPLLEEGGALRVANSARLNIPCRDHAFGEEVTIEMWFLPTELDYGYHLPLLERGWQHTRNLTVQPLERETGKYDFSLYFCYDLPGFVTGNTGTDKVGTEGLIAYGSRYGGNIRRYYNFDIRKPCIIHAKSSEIFRRNYWHHIAAVYDRGATWIYLNGIKIAENPERREYPFLTSGLPLHLGSFQFDDVENKNTAEMLVKSLCIEGKALGETDILRRFNSEKTFFDLDRRRPNLSASSHYYSEDKKAADPNIIRRLNITDRYMKNPPADPYPKGSRMTARIGDYCGLMINGRKEAQIQTKMFHYDRSLRRRKEILSDFAAAGIDIQNFDVRKFWLAENKYNWKELDRFLELYVRNCPTAKLEIHVDLNPPAWVREKYPEEQEKQIVSRAGDPVKLAYWKGHGSFLGSDLYMNMTFAMLRALVTYCEKSPYASHIFGYHVMGGDSGEWFWPGLFSNGGITGYSIPTRNLFRNYVRKIYRNDIAALRDAWKDSRITFDTIEIPGRDERFASSNFIFRDPVNSRKITDLRHFLQERTLYCAENACRALKETAGKNKLVSTYFGYPMFFTGRQNLSFSGLQTVSDMLRSPYVDRIATPVDYEERRGGQPGVLINGFNGTAELYGKSIWREEDGTTHLNMNMQNGRTSTLRETNEVQRRAFGYTMAGPWGFWYCWQMPLHGFHQNEIMENIAAMKKLADQSVRRIRRSTAEVAVIYDEKDSLTYTSANVGGPFLRRSTWEVYRTLHQAGAPFDMFFMSDLDHPKMRNYKVYIFLNAWSVTPEMKKKIHAKLKRSGNPVVVWQYAPGYLDGNRFSLQNMKELTGMEFSENRTMMTLGKSFTRRGNTPLLQGISDFAEAELGPVLSATGKDAEILLKCDGYNVLAEKQMPSWRSLWTLFPLTKEFARNIYDYAGVHVYSRRGETLIANNAYLMVHTAAAGPVKLQFPAEYRVKELIRNRDFGKCRQLQDEAAYKGTTLIYSLVPVR